MESGREASAITTNAMKTFALCLVAYSLVAYGAFGNLFAALTFWVFWSDRLGAQFWPALVSISALLSAAVFLPPLNRLIGRPCRPAIFIASTMLISLLSVGIYADRLRNDGIIAFRPDAYFQHSFFKSIREPRKEHQLYLHAGALKDCVPYAWSYRDMSFYRLRGAVAVNVVPGQWTTKCGIKPEY